jgi:hypothetical protein
LTFGKTKVIHSMTNILSLLAKHAFRLSSITLASLLIIFYSCNKDDVYDFDTNRVDDHFDFFQSDSVVKIRTSREDSIRSDEFTRDLLGVYKDASFGQVKASVFAELRLPVADVAFGINPVFDSIVLYLKYYSADGYFGWLNDPFKFNVYELNERIYRDSAYYSTSSFNYYPDILGSWTGMVKPSDNDVIRIVLTNDLASRIINASEFQLADDDDFLDMLNGIAIIPEQISSTGSIVYFDLENDSSNMTLYYRNDKDTMTAIFQINDECARINKFEQDLAGTPIEEQLNNPTKLYDKVYIKPLAGSKARIDFSDQLKKLGSDNLLAINRAELIIKPDLSLSYLSKAPPSLLLLQTDKDNTNFAIIDRYEDYFDGIYNPQTESYSIIITRFIQKELVNYYNDTNYESEFDLNLIIPSDNPIVADPLVIRANQDLSSAILKLSYTKVK